MHVKKVIICDDKNKFPIKEILDGYKSFNAQEKTEHNEPEIYTFICDNGTMLLQQANNGDWIDVHDVHINNDNKNSCAASFVDQIDRWATNGTDEEVVLVCMDFYWGDQSYNEEFRDLIIDGINKKNNNQLKMIIYTTAAQQMADRFVAAMQDSASSALIGAASYDISKNGSRSKWKNIFKSVNKFINK